MSNQGGQYGEPQYQQPQYQQPQYQQPFQGQPYPQWQPSGPRKSRGGLIAALSLIGVLVLGLATVGVIRATSNDDGAQPSAPSVSTAGPTQVPSGEPTRGSTAAPTPTAAPSTGSSAGPTAGPTAGPAATGPVLCAEGGVYFCFPQATVASMAKVLTAKGGKCRKSHVGDTVCRKGSGAANIDVTLQPDFTDAAKLGDFGVMTGSRVAGANPGGRALVIANLKASLPTLLTALLPNEPKTRQDIATWLTRNVERCPANPVMLDGYLVDCDLPTKFTLTDGATHTSWTFGLNINASTAFKPRR